jgi:hypothetical protein
MCISTKEDAETRSRRFFAEDYIQHNPRYLEMNDVTHATGRDAWVQARKAAACPAGGKRGVHLTDPVMIMAEGELVTAIYKYWDAVQLAPGWRNQSDHSPAK